MKTEYALSVTTAVTCIVNIQAESEEEARQIVNQDSGFEKNNLRCGLGENSLELDFMTTGVDWVKPN